MTAEIRSAGGDLRSGAFSPRVPVAIKSETASRIATVSVAVTSITGAFIDPQSRCISPRLVVREWAKGSRKNDFALGRNRHRHADLDREHRESDDQAQRQ